MSVCESFGLIRHIQLKSSKNGAQANSQCEYSELWYLCNRKVSLMFSVLSDLICGSCIEN